MNLVNRCFVLTVLAGTTAIASAQGLPEGKGLETVVVACTQCHGLDRLMKVRLTAAEWENALYDMMARGAIVEKSDLATVRDYLARNLATDRTENR
jgi:hypothetical protein